MRFLRNIGSVSRFRLVRGVFGGIKTFVRDTNQLIALIAVLRVSGNAMVHADRNREIEWTKNFREDYTNTTAKTGGLKGVGLRKQQREFVAADAEG
jgi:hypothetical protein